MDGSSAMIFFLINFLLSIVPQTTSSTNRPNIIFILSDDHGWNDVSYHGMNEILTPNIDTLAGAGLVLDNYYVQPTCTPSRSALLTGKYPLRLGTQHLPFMQAQADGLPLNNTLLPQYLKTLGYSTHAVGKWHLGFYKKVYTPMYRGFDTHYGYWGGAMDFYSHTFFDRFQNKLAVHVPNGIGNETIIFSGYDFRDNMEPATNSSGFIADLLTERAVQIIRQHDKKKPLFLYFAQSAVHGPPIDVPLRTPLKYKQRFSHIKHTLRKNFAGYLTELDESVGDVVEALYEADMLENTIVIFSSDNGADNAIFPNGGSNYPLRGSKGSVFEGGIRVPGIIWSPLIPNLPRVSRELMHISDWLPTLYNAAGGAVSDIKDIDGIDQWAMITENKSGLRKNMVVNIDQVWNISAYRDGDFKIVLGRNKVFNVDNWYGPTGLDPLGNYVLYNNKVQKVFRAFYKTTRSWRANLSPLSCGKPPEDKKDQCMTSPCLFNLKDDPCEHNDISSSNLEKTEELLKKMNSYVPIKPFTPLKDFNSDPMKHCGLWTNWMDEDHETCNCVVNV